MLEVATVTISHVGSTTGFSSRDTLQRGGAVFASKSEQKSCQYEVSQRAIALTILLVLGTLRYQRKHPVSPESLIRWLILRVRIDKTRRGSQNDADITAEVLR